MVNAHYVLEIAITIQIAQDHYDVLSVKMWKGFRDVLDKIQMAMTIVSVLEECFVYIFLFTCHLFSPGFMPKFLPGIVNYVGECGTENYLCGKCEGDCDDDNDCMNGLICFQRSGAESVPGCSGAGGDRDVNGKDICFDPNDVSQPTAKPTKEIPELIGGPYPFSLRYHTTLQCSPTSPCQKCTGGCSSDRDCAAGLSCFNRTGLESIPGCVTGGIGDVSDINYCYTEPQHGPVSFIPGEFTVSQNGLSLSTGLSSRLIASSGSKVSYDGGGQSSFNYHPNPDFGATFTDISGSNLGG